MTTKKKLGRVMMIDDEEIDQMIYKRTLIKSGLTDDVIGFTSAEDALEYLAGDKMQKVDLILLDINMPRMTGFEFLEAVRQRIGMAFNIPIVMMLTTSLNPRDKARAAEFEIVKAYVNKPLHADTLQDAVNILDGLRTA
jgi:CheY-like chemotaxis protein